MGNLGSERLSDAPMVRVNNGRCLDKNLHSLTSFSVIFSYSLLSGDINFEGLSCHYLFCLSNHMVGLQVAINIPF